MRGDGVGMERIGGEDNREFWDYGIVLSLLVGDGI